MVSQRWSRGDIKAPTGGGLWVAIDRDAKTSTGLSYSVVPRCVINVLGICANCSVTMLGVASKEGYRYDDMYTAETTAQHSQVAALVTTGESTGTCTNR